jgi:hypothetical protein
VTSVATANVLRSLPRHEARAALTGVLALDPDLVGLQEWGVTRHRLLRERPDYVWVAPLVGGCPVGVRADRFDVLRRSSRALGWVGRSDPGARPLPVLPPRFATVVVLRDNRWDEVVTVVNFHLVPGVQAGGRYRADRPLLVARHRAEVRALERVVREQLAGGGEVYATGDSNFHGLRLTGLTSAWEGREDGPGTHGPRRRIDDVHGPGPSTSVTLLTNASDHKAVVVTRERA